MYILYSIIINCAFIKNWHWPTLMYNFPERNHFTETLKILWTFICCSELIHKVSVAILGLLTCKEFWISDKKTSILLGVSRMPGQWTRSVGNRYNQQSQRTKKGLSAEKITWPHCRPKAWQQWNFKPRKSPLISVLLCTLHSTASPVAAEFLLKGSYCHTCSAFPTQKEKKCF